MYTVYLKITLILAFFCQTAFSSGVIIVGNGGDVVYCKPVEGSQFFGYIPLDYISNVKFEDILISQNAGTALAAISHKLGPWAIDLSSDLSRFSAELLSDRPNNKYIWQKAHHGLVAIDDEELLALLPSNCRMNEANGQPHLIQAVVRKKMSGNKILFKYDPQFLGPESMLMDWHRSFLTLHEWLWNYLPNAEVVRQVNYLLHQNNENSPKGAELLPLLENFGFSALGDEQSSMRTLEIAVKFQDEYFATNGVFSDKSIKKLRFFNNTDNDVFLQIQNESIHLPAKMYSLYYDVKSNSEIKVIGTHWIDHRLSYFRITGTVQVYRANSGHYEYSFQ